MDSTAYGIWSPHVFASGVEPPVGAVPSMAAVQSLLTFGAILPPLTPWEGMSRTEHTSEYPVALRITREVCASSDATSIPNNTWQSTARDLLDEQLTKALVTGRRPLVLFSGGVDSGLIAARLKALGRDDIVLVHYQFSPQDPETPIASKLAEEMGLDLKIITRDNSGLSLLDHPGQLYPIPFGDLSALPTYELCRGLGHLVEPDEFVVFDGSGADAAFGLGRKLTRLRKLAGLPASIRAVGSKAYELRGWRLSGSPEYATRLARRAAKLSPVALVLAQNSLFDILYRAPDLQAIDTGWGRILQNLHVDDLAERVVLSGLAVTEAGIFAQKSLGPLRAQGFEVSYPFLTNELARLGMSHTAAFPEENPKSWMKEQLATHVSHDLVYRPKRGFVEPEMTVFDSTTFREHLEAVLDKDGGAVQELIDVRAIRPMVNRAGRLGSLPVGHLNVIWSLMFTSRWFETASYASSDKPSGPLGAPLA